MESSTPPSNEPTAPQASLPWLGLLLIAMIGAATVLAKQPHIDDPVYLGMAVRILENPLDPFRGQVIWGTGDWFGQQNPPLWSYALAATIFVAGWSNLALHATAALAYGFLVFGLYRIAARVSSRPLRWTAVIALAPFLLPGVNLMVDAPMLALWLWSLEWQFRAWTSRRRGAGWIAGALAGAAVLTKYTAALLGPLFLFGAWRYRRPSSLVALLPLAGTVGLWLLHNQFYYGRLHLFAQNVEPGWSTMPERLQVLLRHVGSVVWLTPIWCLTLWSRGVKTRIALAAIAALSVSLGYFDARYVGEELLHSRVYIDRIASAHYFVFTFNGFLTIATGAWLCMDGCRRSSGEHWRARQVIVVWAILGLAFNLVTVPIASFGAIRHFVTFLVPLTLATAGGVDRAMASSRLGGFVGRMCLIASVLLGLAIAIADLETSFINRRIVEEVIAPLAKSGNVWYIGDPSLQYLADPAGGRILFPDRAEDLAKPRRGDALVVPYLQSGGLGAPRLVRDFMEEDHHPFSVWTPLRTVTLTTNYYGGNRLSLAWKFAPVWLELEGEEPFLSMPPQEDVYIYRVQ